MAGLPKPFVVIEQNGQRQTYAVPGEDGHVEVLPIAPLTAAQIAQQLTDAAGEQIAFVELRRDRAIAGGFTFGDHRFQSDPLSAANIEGYALSALRAEVRGEDWTRSYRLEDNSEIPIGRAMMIEVGQAWEDHKQDCYRQSWQLKAELLRLAALPTTAEELDGRLAQIRTVDVDAGWPGQTDQA